LLALPYFTVHTLNAGHFENINPFLVKMDSYFCVGKYAKKMRGLLPELRAVQTFGADRYIFEDIWRLKAGGGGGFRNM
jgi:hypothetical protein